MNSERIRTFLLRTGLLLGIVAGLLTVFVNLATLRCFNAIFDATCSVSTTRNLVALTFNDGPGGSSDEVAADLARHGAKATFFVSGQKLEREMPAARRLLAAGHELGNMAWSNQLMEDQPQSFHEAEITQTDALLRKAGVKQPDLFRPPFGVRSVGLLWELHKRDYHLVMWDVSDNGRREAPPEAYANAILAQVRPGSIVMMNALGADDEEARAALPLILAGLDEKGLKSVTVSELFAAQGR